MTQRIEVVAAVIYRADGAILLAQRGQHQHQGGKWEFPGGKLEAGENRLRALSRELLEELGIQCNLAQPLMSLDHDYADKSVRLHFFEVRDWLGQAEGKEGQLLDWVLPEQLIEKDFPAANLALVQMLALGSQLLIWPDAPPVQWQVRLHLALQRGVKLVYARNIRDEALLAQQLAICHQHGAKLLVSDDVALMQRVGADGVHLRAASAQALTARPQVPLLSVACHNAAELQQAQALQADFALLGAVRATDSHADAKALGWPALAQLLTGVSLPVFALGGVGPADLVEARARGAWGVAGISAFWPPEQLLHV